VAKSIASRSKAQNGKPVDMTLPTPTSMGVKQVEEEITDPDEVPMAVLPFFKYLNKSAQRALMRQLISSYESMSISESDKTGPREHAEKLVRATAAPLSTRGGRSKARPSPLSMPTPTRKASAAPSPSPGSFAVPPLPPSALMSMPMHAADQSSKARKRRGSHGSRGRKKSDPSPGAGSEGNFDEFFGDMESPLLSPGTLKMMTEELNSTATGQSPLIFAPGKAPMPPAFPRQKAMSVDAAVQNASSTIESPYPGMNIEGSSSASAFAAAMAASNFGALGAKGSSKSSPSPGAGSVTSRTGLTPPQGGIQISPSMFTAPMSDADLMPYSNLEADYSSTFIDDEDLETLMVSPQAR